MSQKGCDSRFWIIPSVNAVEAPSPPHVKGHLTLAQASQQCNETHEEGTESLPMRPQYDTQRSPKPHCYTRRWTEAYHPFDYI